MKTRFKKRKNKKTKTSKSGKVFWNKEYNDVENLALSQKPSSDLDKFFRWLSKKDKYYWPQGGGGIVDVGCGNGRNIIYACKKFSCDGFGYDISSVAIDKAKKLANENNCNVKFVCMDMNNDIPIASESQKLVLDMMASHVLKKEERKKLLKEIFRILEPGGFFFYKTFLLDGDKNAKNLIRNYPAKEKNSYIHPKIGTEEHVFTQEELENDVSEFFTILKVYKSHRHLNKDGSPNKRRSIVLYLQKNEF